MEENEEATLDRIESVVDTKPPVEFLTIRNLDTGDAYVIGENDPDFDFDTFAIEGNNYLFNDLLVANLCFRQW